MSTDVPLSKWWTTPSAQAAFARAKAERQQKFEQMKRRIADKKQQLDHEIWGKESKRKPR